MRWTTPAYTAEIRCVQVWWWPRIQSSTNSSKSASIRSSTQSEDSSGKFCWLIMKQSARENVYCNSAWNITQFRILRSMQIIQHGVWGQKNRKVSLPLDKPPCPAIWIHCCRRPNYDFCISQVNVATVFTI